MIETDEGRDCLGKRLPEPSAVLEDVLFSRLPEYAVLGRARLSAREPCPIPFPLSIVRKTLLILAFFLLLAGATAESKPSAVRIGAIVTLTGDFGFVGSAMQRGAEMRLREDPDKIKFIYEDDQTYDRKTVVSAFRKLTTIDQTPLIFITAAPVMEPLTALVSSARVPTIAVWDYNKSMHWPEEYRYSMGFSNELAGAAMANIARKKLNLSRVALVTANDEWSEIVSKSFVDRIGSLGGSIDELGRIDLNDSNLRGLILKAKQLKSPAIFFPLYLTSFSSLVRQARELQYSGTLLTGEGFTEAEARTLGGIADKIYFQRIWVSDPAFHKKYSESTGDTKQPADIGFVGLGYDMASLALELVDSCIRDNEPINSENIQKWLRTKQFQGVTGKVDFPRFTGKTLATLQLDKGRIIEVDDG